MILQSILRATLQMSTTATASGHTSGAGGFNPRSAGSIAGALPLQPFNTRTRQGPRVGNNQQGGGFRRRSAAAGAANHILGRKSNVGGRGLLARAGRAGGRGGASLPYGGKKGPGGNQLLGDKMGNKSGMGKVRAIPLISKL